MTIAPAGRVPWESTVGRPLEERPWWPVAMWMAGIWVAFVNASLWWLGRWPVPRTLWGDEETYLGSAVRLLAGDPNWWPEPLWPPLYTQFLAGFLWLARGSLTGVVVVQNLLLAVTAVIFFDLTRRFTRSRSAGIAAAVLTMGYPPLVGFSHFFWPEILHLFLFAALLWLLVARWDRGAWCAVAGVVLGLALLTKSLLMPYIPILLLAAAWGTRPRQAMVRIVVVLTLAAATVAPTIAANASRTGTPMIANSGPFNLWVGLNDVGRENFSHDVVWPEYLRWKESAASFDERNRIVVTQIRDFIRERGPVAVVRAQLSKQWFRLFDAGCYLTDQLPGGAAFESGRAGYLGVPWVLGRVLAATAIGSIVMLLVLAPAGFIFGGYRTHRWVGVLLLFVAYNLILFLGLHVKTRYRIQMLPTAFIGVGCLVAWAEAGFRPRPTLARLGGAILVIAFLLWFSLG